MYVVIKIIPNTSKAPPQQFLFVSHEQRKQQTKIPSNSRPTHQGNQHRRQMTNTLDIMPIQIRHKRGIIPSMILRPQPRRSIALSPGLQPSFIKRADLRPILGGERDVTGARVPSFVATGHNPEAGLVGAKTVDFMFWEREDFSAADRGEQGCVEGTGRRDVVDVDSDVVEH